LEFWDFYDVTNDSKIDFQDALAILGKFGLEPGQQGYDPLFDRYAPDASKKWRTAADSNGIDLKEVLLSLASFGHDCR
jgi:hypothetical protein